MKIIITILLVSLCTNTVLIQSNTELKMISPDHIGQSVVQMTKYTSKIPQAPDAMWIWSKGWDASTCVNPLIIQGTFLVQSGNPITFYVGADDNFTLLIDGNKVLEGADWLKIFQTNFPLSCGLHTYKIISYNFGLCTGSNAAGLIFAFVQDTSTVKGCFEKLPFISNTYLKMSSPDHIGQSVVQMTKYTSKIPQAPDAMWIWSKGWNASTCVNPLIIQGTFLVQSGNPITFYVGADDNFTLLIDGNKVLEGADWLKIFQTNFPLSCGSHTFKIISYNNGPCTPDNAAGLIYAFVQDTTTVKGCFKKLPVVSNTELKMISPGHIGQSVVQMTKYTSKIPQAPDAMWIWSKGWDASTCVNPLIIQGTFLVQSGNLITFYVGADDNFTLLIDGNNVLEGGDWQKIFQTNFWLSCGLHTYKIISYNNGPCSSNNAAGLIFAFVQDTSTVNGCFEKLPFVSNTYLKMSSPGNIGQSVVQMTKYTSKIPQAPDAMWIWSKGWNASTCVNPLIIQGTFLVQSGNPITFYVGADDNFTLLIDGNKVLEGADWLKIFQTNFPLSCGSHTFKIISYNNGPCTPDNAAGLIYAFVQDTTTVKGCFKKLPVVSNTELKMISPGHIGQSVVQMTKYTSKISQAPDAMWIWSKGWNASTCVNPLIIQGTFLVQSGNLITFYVGADDNFKLLIDGINMLEGADWLKIYSTNSSLSCGLHTFKIISYNNGPCSLNNPAGLIYAFVQDTSTVNGCFEKLPFVSNTYLKMSSPGHIGQSVVQMTKYTNKIPQAPDAMWIWSQGWNASTCVNPLIIQGTFLVQSENPITFYVGADDNFKLLIDGINMLEGADWLKIYSTNSSLSCGSHTFKIISYNNGPCTPDNPAGLIYAFVQDTNTNKCVINSGVLRFKKSPQKTKSKYFKKFTHLASSKHGLTKFT